MVELVDRYDEDCIPADASDPDAAYSKRIGYIQDDTTNKTCIRTLTVSLPFHDHTDLFMYSIAVWTSSCSKSLIFYIEFVCCIDAAPGSKEDEASYLCVLSAWSVLSKPSPVGEKNHLFCFQSSLDLCYIHATTLILHFMVFICIVIYRGILWLILMVEIQSVVGTWMWVLLSFA